jgi:RHS repeat-associated protein
VDIDPDNGGKFTSKDQRLEIDFPSGAVNKHTKIKYRFLNTSAYSDTLTSPHWRFVLTAEEITGKKPNKKFNKPLKFTIRLDKMGYVLGQFDARQMWFGYFDDTTQQWVSIPFEIVEKGNKLVLEAQVDHFTTFGYNGKANPGWALKFDEPIVALASGAATYNYPLQVPAGRGGLQPSLALSYSSRNVDHLKGYYQSDWVGHGWSLAQVEIVRRTGDKTTQTDVECTNDFSLVFNGTGYTLIAGPNNRYYTQEDSQLYIEYIPTGGQAATGAYWIIRNGDGTTYRLGYTDSAEQRVRCTAESGGGYKAFRWRLDKVLDKFGNQMKMDYVTEARTNCPNSGGPTDVDRASYPWHIWYNNLNQSHVTNINDPDPTSWGVQINFTRSPRPTANGNDDGFGACDKLFFQADYLSSIEVYVYVSAVPKILRQYQLGYELKIDSKRGTDGTGSRVLTSIQEIGWASDNTAQALPAVRFGYSIHAIMDVDCTPGVNCGAGPANGAVIPTGWAFGDQVWQNGTNGPYYTGTWGCRWHSSYSDPYYAWTHYGELGHSNPYQTGYENPQDCAGYTFWHLATVSNGYGATTTFIYGHDNRGAFWYDGYNYRVVKRLIQADNRGPAVTEYIYNTPCYATTDANSLQSSGGVKCPMPSPDENKSVLMAHRYVQVIQRDYTNNILSYVTHWFNVGDPTDPNQNKLVGKEYQTESFNAQGRLLTIQTNYYSATDLTGPTNRWAVRLNATVNHDYNLVLDAQSRQTNYYYDSYGNQTAVEEFSDAGFTRYRLSATDYFPNSSPSIWILNKPAQQYTKSWNGSAWETSPVLNMTRYIYDNGAATAWSSAPTSKGQLTAVRSCVTANGNACASGSVWSDTRYEYDATWTSNLYKTTTYTDYGTDTAFATGGPFNSFQTQDTSYALYPYESWNDTIAPRARTNYDARTGLVTSDYDANGAGTTTTYTYDRFGRLLTAMQPVETGSTPTLRYEYRDPSFPWVNAVNSHFEWDEGWAVGWDQTRPSWMTYSTSQAHSGSNSLRISYAGPWPDWVGQKFVPGWTGGATYKISAWVRADSACSSCFQMVVADGSGNVTPYVNVTTAWQLVTLTATISGSGTRDDVILYFHGSGTIYVDDVYIQAENLEIGAYFKEDNGSSSTIWARQVYDGMGRAIQDQSEENGNAAIVVDREYDARGLVTRSTVPYNATSNPNGRFFVSQTWTNPQTTTQYDALGRTTRALAPDSTSSSAIYGVRYQTSLDANRHLKLSINDAFGRTTSIFESLVKWQDTFSDGVLTGWTMSTGAGSVSETGGVLRLVGNGTYNTYASRPANTISNNEGIIYDFKFDPGSVAAATYLSTGTWGTSNYRRWGVDPNGSTIYLFQYEGTTSTSTALMSLTTGKWYRILLKIGSSTDEFIVQVWERDNPTVISERRLSKGGNWANLQWNFWVQNALGAIEIDNYDELTFNQTRYTYTAQDQLYTVTDPAGNQTSITYDAAGRKLTMDDPDMGYWRYTYDAVGNLTQQRDAKQQTLCFVYDPLNRLTEKRQYNTGCTVATSTLLASYGYDSIAGGNFGLGRRTFMSVPGTNANSASWVYDARGRVTSETRTIGTNYVTQYEYDPMDRVRAIIYPGTGERVEQTYTARGLLGTVASASGANGYGQSYAASLAYDAAERLTAMVLGNGLSKSYTYYAWTTQGGRLQRIQTGTVQNLTYTYDAVGNVNSIADGTTNSGTNPGGGQTQYFGYDALDRLVSAYTTGGSGTTPYNQTFSYTANGNFITMAGSTHNYTNPLNLGGTCEAGTQTSKPHAVRSATDPNGTNTYQYDCNGNMRERVEAGTTYTQNFDIENRLASVQTVTGTTYFVYDADGARVMQIQPGGKTIAYVGNLLEVEIQPTATPTNTPTKTATPTNTPTRTPTPTNTPVGPTNTPTPTATNTSVPGSFCSTVLDDFNRANGSIGSNWSGSTGGYSINANRLDADTGNNYIYWNPTSFGPDQEACLTLTTIDTAAYNFDLLLKSQSSSTWSAGLIDVTYLPAYNVVQVWTYAPGGQSWVQHGADIPVTFANGDRFGAKAKADGTVEVYKNSTLVGSRSVATWTLHTSTLGGYLGLVFFNASNMLADDFAGGNVGGPTATPTNTPAGPTNTPTRTPTNTPAGPTNTPTPTNTPVGPTNTPTRTPTPSNTPTNTPPPTPTNTSSGCPTSDDFNRANSTNLGANWTERAGDLEINSNLLRNVGTAADNLATLCGTYTNVLVSSQVQIASGTGTVSVGARLGGYSGGVPAQGYTAEIESNGTVNLWRVDNFTLLGSYTISGFSLGTWYTLALRANGSSISVEVNGNTVIGPVTDSAFTSGNAGVWSYAPTSAGSHRFDNFSVTVLGGGVYRKVKVLAMTDARRRAVVSAPPANTTYRVYYYAAGRPIAMREMPTGDNTGTLYYLHSDHLGSTSVTTCGSGTCGAAGSVVARQWYYPYGAVRGSVGTLPTQRTFTGQYSDSYIKLVFMGARAYNPEIGRFVSADSIVPEAGNPQALNRYSYVANSPLKYVDPSGHCWGIASGLRGTWLYGATCPNIDMALTIIQHPEASAGQKIGAGVYLAVAAGAHFALAAGSAGLACGAVGPACVKPVEAAIGIGTAACADGDCGNEANLAIQGLPRITQAVQNGLDAIRNGIGRGYSSFNSFKYSEGSAGQGMAWHHIVEQNAANASRFGAQAIHNTNNLIRLPQGANQLHNQISGYYSSIQPLVTGSSTMTVRQWLATKPFEFQWQFGIDLIRRFGGDQYIIGQFGK